MNGDEDLGQDIIMKGEKFHYNQSPPEAVKLQISAGPGPAAGNHEADEKVGEKKPESKNNDNDPPLCKSHLDKNCNLTPQIVVYPA